MLGQILPEFCDVPLLGETPHYLAYRDNSGAPIARQGLPVCPDMFVKLIQQLPAGAYFLVDTLYSGLACDDIGAR